MKIFFDTEFYEDGHSIHLISIGMVREDGAAYYAETTPACIFASRSDWLAKNVLPHLDATGNSHRYKVEMRKDIIEFAGDQPEFWAYYADYDWVVLCQLFGTMMDLPKGWPMFCMDVKQLQVSLDPTIRLPGQEGQEHNALADAMHCKAMYDFLMRRSADA